MKIISLILVCAFVVTHSLNGMQPSLPDKLGRLRTNLDTLKQSFTKLQQRLEELKKSLQKPSGSGDTSGSKRITPFSELPEEVKKIILSLDITFSIGDSDLGKFSASMKAAAEKLNDLAAKSTTIVQQWLSQQSVQIGVMCHLLKQHIDNTKSNVGYADWQRVFSPALQENNVVIWATVLEVAGDKMSESLVGNSQSITKETGRDKLQELYNIAGSKIAYGAFPNIITFGSPALVRSIIKDLGAEEARDVITSRHNDKNALELAILTNNTEKVMIILKALGSENEVLRASMGGNNFTTLHCAILMQNAEMVDEILRALGSKASEVVLAKADLQDWLKGGKYFKGLPNVHDPMGIEHSDKFKNMIDFIDLDYGDFLKQLTTLQCAVYGDNVTIVQALLKAAGNRVNELLKLQDSEHKTVLRFAVQNEKNVKIVEPLLNAVPSIASKLINMQDTHYGNTLLHEAVMVNNLEIVQLILKYGGHKILMIKNKDGKTVFDLLGDKEPKIKTLLESYLKK